MIMIIIHLTLVTNSSIVARICVSTSFDAHGICQRRSANTLVTYTSVLPWVSVPTSFDAHDVSHWRVAHTLVANSSPSTGKCIATSPNTHLVRLLGHCLVHVNTLNKDNQSHLNNGWLHLQQTDIEEHYNINHSKYWTSDSSALYYD